MKLNSTTKINGKNVILVPYKDYHVPKYHDWMQSEELQKLTASESLTIKEEYAMQKSWLEDDDKCTFILLDKYIYNKSLNEVDSMIGDTNIFITNKEPLTGEIEIMIAEKSARGKKFGWEAVVLMLLYGIKIINLKCFEAKIGTSNNISVQMFEKLGFKEISRSAIFNEITFNKEVSNDWLSYLESQFDYKYETCLF